MARSGPQRGRPRVHDQEAILDAAARALVARGFPNLRFADVAAESGVPVPSLQHRFDSLHDMRTAALCRKVRLELADHVAALADVEDPWEWVAAMVERSVSPPGEERILGWALWVEYHHAAAHDDAIAKDADEVDALWCGAIAAKVAMGVDSGRFVTSLSPMDAARVIQAMIDGLGSTLVVARSEEFVADTSRLIVRAAAALLGVDGAATRRADALFDLRAGSAVAT